MKDFDVTSLTDEELRELAGVDVSAAAPGRGLEEVRKRGAAAAELGSRGTRTRAEEIEPSATLRGLAALWGRLREPVVGLAEKAQLAFPGGTSSAAEATRKRIGEERTERRELQRGLEETPAGEFGGFVGQVAPLAVAPFRAIPQAVAAGAAGFLGGGRDQPGGIGQELVTSGISGATEGALTGAATGAARVLGKAFQGARGKFTPQGEEALATDAAARRLGIPSPTVGQLDPQSPEALRAPARLVQEQAEALGRAVSKPIELPEGSVSQTGGAYLDELNAAVKKRLDLGSDKYAEVDRFIADEGLPPLMPKYSANMVTASNSKGYDLAAQIMEKYGLPLAPMANMSAKELGAIPLSMKNMHELRVTTNRAIRYLDRVAETPSRVGDPEVNAARKYLRDLKTAVDSDMKQWASNNKGNAEALKLYEGANAYWRDVVGPTISDNPLAKKLLSKTRGFDVPIEAVIASTSTKGNALTDLLRPTMTGRGEDMTRALRNLPDVRAMMLDAQKPAPSSRGALATLAASAGHPVTAALNYAPGLSWLSRTTPVKRAYFGQAPETRALIPATQYPLGGLEEWGRERLGIK